MKGGKGGNVEGSLLGLLGASLARGLHGAHEVVGRGPVEAEGGLVWMGGREGIKTVEHVGGDGVEAVGGRGARRGGGRRGGEPADGGGEGEGRVLRNG